MKQKIQKIGIIGFGRFGTLLAEVCGQQIPTIVYDSDTSVLQSLPNGVVAGTIAEVCESDIVFIAVPISQFESTLIELVSCVSGETILVDVLSVKVHSATLFEKYCRPKSIATIAMHPMFGPDSFESVQKKHTIAVCPVTASRTQFDMVCEFVTANFNATCIELTPDEHDKYAAYSQGVTHYIGRVLDEMNIVSTPLDTKGFASLLEVREQTCHDSWQLFFDLQKYNPYTREMRTLLKHALHAVDSALLPPPPEKLTIGIQGGKGSFNEEAARFFCEQQGFTDYEIVYLYTSERVMAALEAGEITYGQCAVHNAIGGVVHETLDALTMHVCRVAYDIPYEVNHCLLASSGIGINSIDTIMSHPQALAQCHSTLAREFGDKKTASGEGDSIDQSLVAKQIGAGELPKNIAVLAPKICAELYGLDVLAEGLQDLERNITTFLWFERV